MRFFYLFIFMALMGMKMFGQQVLKDTIPQEADTTLIIHAASDTVDSNVAAEFTGGVHARDFDKLVTIDNKVIIARITSVKPTEINFIYPLNTIQNSIDRDLVNYVIHNNGTKEVFTLVETKESDNEEVEENFLLEKEKKKWEEIVATYLEQEIEGMTEIESLLVEFQSNKMRASNEYLEKNALIILRKKTANVGGEIVLITEKKINKAYGDLPSIEMSGIAFTKPASE